MSSRSIFLELPAEIRLEIYSYVFAWPSPGPTHQAHLAKAAAKGLACGVCYLGYRRSRIGGSYPLVYRPNGLPEDATSILRVCRLTYEEGTDALYKKTLFIVTSEIGPRVGYYENTVWRMIGTAEECHFLKNVRNIEISSLCTSAADGQGMLPMLRLLGHTLTFFGGERRLMDVQMYVEMRRRTSDLYVWNEVAATAAAIDFACVPRMCVAFADHPWWAYGEFKYRQQQIDEVLVHLQE